MRPTRARVARSATPRRRKRDFVTFGLGAWSAPRLHLPVSSDRVRDHLLVHDKRLVPRLGRAHLKGYRRLFDNEQLKHSIGNSLKVAGRGTIIAMILGGLAGIALARRSGKWSRPFMLLVFLILVTPEIVDAIGYLIWFVKLAVVVAVPLAVP